MNAKPFSFDCSLILLTISKKTYIGPTIFDRLAPTSRLATPAIAEGVAGGGGHRQ